MVDKQRTRKESLISALKWGMAFLVLVCASGYALFRAVANDADAVHVLVFQFKITIPLFTLLFMWLVYRVNRNEMTWQELEDEEKAKARRLLAKYPELKDE